MKAYKYIVSFSKGLQKTIYANSEEQAKILAQAEAINECKDYQVMSVEKIKDSVCKDVYCQVVSSVFCR